MDTVTIDDDYHLVNSNEICWASPRIAPLDAIDLLTLDDRELFDYARDLQAETGSLRALVHEALAVVSRLTVQLARARVRIDQLLRELRLARQEARDLRVQLRALTESRGVR